MFGREFQQKSCSEKVVTWNGMDSNRTVVRCYDQTPEVGSCHCAMGLDCMLQETSRYLKVKRLKVPTFIYHHFQQQFTV